MSTGEDYQYEGQELDLFALADNWRAYWLKEILPYLRGAMLEVGSGIGSNITGLCATGAGSLTCLEPDPAQANRLRERVAGENLQERVRVITGNLADLTAEEKFDVILYIDVLEHIPDDAAEVLRAVRRLTPGGSLIVLSPAFPFLYTAFDEAIGHCRRYTKTSLREAVPANTGLQLQRLVYLDSLGFVSSCANRFFLHQSTPTRKQLLFWDRVLMPISRRLDPLIFHSVGKSLLGVWRKMEQSC